MNTVTKEVQLNDVVFVVEIDEVDLNTFIGREIAVAKAYANFYGKCKHEMISIMAWCKKGEDLDIMRTILGKAFG